MRHLLLTLEDALLERLVKAVVKALGLLDEDTIIHVEIRIDRRKP